MATEGAPGVVMCSRHPSVPTGLRCSRCGTPICPRCMVQTPVGARCPDCAKPSGGLPARPTARLYAQSTSAGLAAALASGAVLGLIGNGLLSMFLMVIGGYVVGEAVTRASRRLPYRELAVVAFGCTCIGLVVGRAAVVALMIPLPDIVLRLTVALMASVQVLGPLGLLVAALAGVVAAGRVMR